MLRSGARVGDVVAVCGSLGLSGGGLLLLERGEADPDRAPTATGGGTASDVLGERDLAVRALMRHHRAPVAPWRAGPVAADAGAHALIDVSDGLVTDLGRVAAASGVSVDLDGPVLRDRFAAGPLTLALGAQEALHQVLAGGEEHALVATFADEESVPRDDDEPWRVIGRVVAPGPEGPRRHRRRGRARRPRLGPLRPLTGIRHPLADRSIRPMREASGQHHNRSGANVKVPGSGGKVVARGGRRGCERAAPVRGAARSVVRQGVSA